MGMFALRLHLLLITVLTTQHMLRSDSVTIPEGLFKKIKIFLLYFTFNRLTYLFFCSDTFFSCKGIVD